MFNLISHESNDINVKKNRIYFTVNFLITITHAPQLIVVIIYIDIPITQKQVP